MRAQHNLHLTPHCLGVLEQGTQGQIRLVSRPEFAFDPTQVNAVLDYLAATSIEQQIRFLWRPFLKDPKDDMVLELAFNAGCSHVVTFNIKDFKDSPQLGIKAILPRDFLALIGGSP